MNVNELVSLVLFCCCCFVIVVLFCFAFLISKEIFPSSRNTFFLNIHRQILGFTTDSSNFVITLTINV